MVGNNKDKAEISEVEDRKTDQINESKSRFFKKLCVCVLCVCVCIYICMNHQSDRERNIIYNTLLIIFTLIHDHKHSVKKIF